MSPGWLVVALIAALALASVSVRALVALPTPLRPGRLVVLLLSSALGVSLAGTFGEWGMWPVGLIVGLAAGMAKLHRLAADASAVRTDA